MVDEHNEDNLSLFVKGAMDLGLTLKECEKALIIKGWPKKFVDKHCKKHYDKRKREMKKSEKAAEEREKRFAKEHIVDDEIERLNRALAELK
ncbi:hypothetical protein KY332_00540 [Candidatus Woesearchaeota archaeon]|nr:hypothetical protein [Candidatus Woesearchaeota archaeon]